MLTETACKNAKPKDKNYAIADRDGLLLEISTTGKKWWRLRLTVNGRRTRRGLGTYPSTSLKQAREKVRTIRMQLENDEFETQEQKNADDTFESLAQDWYAAFRPTWRESHAEKVRGLVDVHLNRYIGHMSPMEIEPQHILSMLKAHEIKGTLETARRVRATCARIFKYGIVTQRAKRNPAEDVSGLLPPPSKVKHHAFVQDHRKIGELLNRMWWYHGRISVQLALRLLPYVFVRPRELRHAQWVHVDFERAEWRIPAAMMKMDRPHIVPLSRQAVDVLRDAESIRLTSEYVFPGNAKSSPVLSDATLVKAIRGITPRGEEQTAHGFRGMASTHLNEGFVPRPDGDTKWNKDAIERQLAHVPGNKIRAAYNHAQYIDERRIMMQAWADYLDSLRLSK